MNISWGILSKYRNELYGFSIIWIILFHGLELKQTALPKAIKCIEPFLKHGNCGVEIFLFLSGICLYFSLIKDNNICFFFKKRISRLIGAFLLIDGSYWMYTCVYQKHSVLSFIQNLTLYSFWVGKSKTVWFIALIIVLYAIYPAIFKLLKQDKSAIFIVIIIAMTYVLCYFCKLNFYEWFNNVEIALTRIPVFLLGCYCGKLVYRDIEIKKSIKLMTLLLLFYGFTYFYQHPYSLVKSYRMPYFFIGPSIALWIAIFLDIIQFKTINRILYLWGGLSLELYLSHIIFRLLFVDSALYGKNTKINYCLYIIVCCLCAFCLSYFVNKISERCIKNISK